MTGPRSSLALVIAACSFGVAGACGSDGTTTATSPPPTLGTPCIPAAEESRNFPGYETTEVSVEAGGATCSTGVCLIAHFRGRVTCPYGQPASDTPDPSGELIVDPSLPTSDRCFVARSKESEANVVTVPVAPQIVSRPPDKAVYCSCRCDGPDPKGSYCSCPSGYACTKLLYSGGDPFEGSYCIKDGAGVEDPEALEQEPACTGPILQPRPVGCGLDKHPGGL